MLDLLRDIYDKVCEIHGMLKYLSKQEQLRQRREQEKLSTQLTWDQLPF